MVPRRLDRRVPEERDQRLEPQRDRDRVLYSSAFRRLAGVTQVVAADEGDFYHNRLTHTIKVAQVARRVAEHLVNTAHAGAFIDPDVCEAAALAHDLGHPPFGHVGEMTLDECVVGQGLADGFEGNAQSFRIVTRLALRRPDFPGLNLTRATLAAILKYPWLRQERGSDQKRHAKYGAYSTEADVLAWARELAPSGSLQRGVEAEIMDWADDVTYAVHDIEDFFRVGLVPIDRLREKGYRARTFQELVARWKRTPVPPIAEDQWSSAEAALEKLLGEDGVLDEVAEPYGGNKAQRTLLRQTSGILIRRYLEAISISKDDRQLLLRDPPLDLEVQVLKELVRHYVIDNPALRSQQKGHIRIVRELFDAYVTAASDDLALLPLQMREAVSDGVPAPRAAADCIAAFTEQQATRIWRRITGISSGSLTDRL